MSDDIVICDQCENEEYPVDFCTCKRCPTCCHVLQYDVCGNCEGEQGESTTLSLQPRLVHKALRAAIRCSADESDLTDIERNRIAQEITRLALSFGELD